MKKAEEYAEIILRDEREKIAGETPVVYEPDKIERLYEFADGAIVRYEWQSFSSANLKEKYNHRLTLVAPPAPNPHKIKTGVIETIDYSGDGER